RTPTPPGRRWRAGARWSRSSRPGRTRRRRAARWGCAPGGEDARRDRSRGRRPPRTAVLRTPARRIGRRRWWRRSCVRRAGEAGAGGAPCGIEVEGGGGEAELGPQGAARGRRRGEEVAGAELGRELADGAERVGLEIEAHQPHEPHPFAVA